MTMDKELTDLLIIAFLPGIVLVIAGAVSAIRNYGITFLWCLRFAPLREKLKSMLRAMHRAPAVAYDPEYRDRNELGTATSAVIVPPSSRRSATPLRRDAA